MKTNALKTPNRANRNTTSKASTASKAGAPATSGDFTYREAVETEEDGIKTVSEMSDILFDGFNGNPDYQKAGTKSIQLRSAMRTTKTYPGGRVGDSMSDSLVDISEFTGLKGSTYDPTVEQRVAWTPVPEHYTEQQCRDLVAQANTKGATLYRVLSNSPIITDEQQYGIDNELVTMDQLADRQVVKYSNGNKYAGECVADPNGNAQYRRVFFANGPKEDIDLRDAEGDVYETAAITESLDRMQANLATEATAVK